MTGDPFIDELRRYRDEFAARFDYDAQAIGRELEERFHSQRALLEGLGPDTKDAEGVAAFETSVKDPIAEEIRRYRDEYAARFNCDVAAMLEDMGRRAAEWEESRRAASAEPDAAARSKTDRDADRAEDAA